MVGRHQWHNRHEFEETLGDSEGQGSLACCSPWGCKESDTICDWTTTKKSYTYIDTYNHVKQLPHMSTWLWWECNFPRRKVKVEWLGISPKWLKNNKYCSGQASGYLGSLWNMVIGWMNSMLLPPLPYSLHRKIECWGYGNWKDPSRNRTILLGRNYAPSWAFHLVKPMVFPVVMNGCESWTIKKAEHWKIDAFELWCWRRLLRVPWTARRSNRPPWIFTGRTDAEAETPITLATWCKELSFEKILMLGKIEGRRRRGQQRMRWLDTSPTQRTWVWVNSGSWWWTRRPGVLQSMGSESDMTEWLNWTKHGLMVHTWFAQVSRLDGRKIYVSTQTDSKSTYLLLEV